MAPSRVRAFAAVCASGVPAGTIDSRNGSAMVTPTPRRNVRCDRCIFEMNINDSGSPILRRGLLHFHLKWLALDHAEYQRGEPVIVLGGAPDDRADRRHIVILNRPAQR